MPEYQKSFEIPKDEIPSECPNCKEYEFDLEEDIQTDQDENGCKSTLSCPICNFELVLSFTTNKDIEEQMNEEELEDNDESYDEEDFYDNDESYNDEFDDNE